MRQPASAGEGLGRLRFARPRKHSRGRSETVSRAWQDRATAGGRDPQDHRIGERENLSRGGRGGWGEDAENFRREGWISLVTVLRSYEGENGFVAENVA
jgi:hypothetical protein